MKKILCVAMALAMFAGVLVVCPSASPAAEFGKQYTIGVACFTLRAEFPAAINEAIHAYVKELGLTDSVKILSVDGELNAARQVGQVENFIAQGVDGIILLPMDADACVPAVEAAAAADIPLVSCNGTVNSDLVTAQVASNDVVAGELEMRYMADLLGGKGQIAILRGPNGISAEILRREGYENILKNYPNIEIVSEFSCNWSREEALSTTENLIQAHPGLAAIVAQNDEMAMGALEAVTNANKQDSIIVGGIDAIADACVAVKEGKLSCTVFQDAVGQARGSVDVILKLVKGEPATDVDIPFILITQKNVDQYIK